jgi:hypothetical protein
MLSREDAARLLDDGGGDPEAVPRVEWEPFFEWLCANWKAGQHVSIFGPNQIAGKTHMIRYGLLPCWQRYFVLILQFKPRDPAMVGMGHEIKHFPTKLDRVQYDTRKYDSPKWDKDPEWFRLRLPAYRWSANGGREGQSYRTARRMAGEAIDKAYWQGQVVLVVDEVRAIAETKQPHLGLEAPLENVWQRGATQPVTLIAATQQPANAPSSMYDQAHFVLLGKFLDIGRHERLSEIGGNTALIKATLPDLEPHEFLFIDRTNGEMCRISAPPAPAQRK